MRLVEREQYFAIHAARQSGKTTLLKALVREINSSGERMALYFTVESVQAYPDPHDGIFKIVECMRSDLLSHPIFSELVRDPSSPIPKLLPQPSDLGVKQFLTLLAQKAGKPLVVFFDEVDGLTEGTVVTFLRELRNGYITRDEIPFPVSVAIVGMMDIRDMKVKVRPEVNTLGSKSPFNIITEDFTLKNFTEQEVADLYAQHTAATGQVFEPEAVAEAYMFTLGQPWLVNAIAQKCMDEIHDGRYDEHVTAADVEVAKEEIIRANPIHLDYLFDMANLPQVKPFVVAGLRGVLTEEQRSETPFKFLRYLGLFIDRQGSLEFANPIYKEYWARRAVA